MTIQIRKHLVSSSIASKVTSGKGNSRRKIVVHETDNTKAGADADAHGRLQANGNSRQASWHYQIDDKEVVQSFDHSYKCWAAGSSKGNNEGIQVEICVNSDGDYKRACENTAKLVAKILKDEKLTINDVVQHNFYSGKNCPRHMRAGSKGISWNQFIQMVKNEMNNKEEDLDMEKYNELKREIENLKKQLDNKSNTHSNEQPSKWAESAWGWAKSDDVKITDGTNPKGAITREQVITIIYRFFNKFINK